MKKVLIISYYFPPAAGAGVQRWLKFIKYFRLFGVEPVAYVPEGADYPLIDCSLEQEIPDGMKIYKGKIFEPNKLLRNKTGNISAGFFESKGKGSIIKRFIVWIRANLFIPDARMFWIKPSVRRIKKILKEEDIDTIISTGPPHSVHMIAMNLKKQFPTIKWIADFRDPWTKIDYFHHLPLTSLAEYRHRAMERKVLKTADDIIVVTKSMYDDFEPQTSGKLHLITNGFDTADIPKQKPPLDSKFSICHIGSMNSDRNPRELWQVLGQIAKKDKQFAKDLQIKLTGVICEDVISSIKESGLYDNLIINDYMPHNEVILQQHSAQMLLLVMNRTPQGHMYIAGKLFEYLAADRPIMIVGFEQSDAADILYKTAAGEAFDWDDTAGMLSFLIASYRDFKKGELFLPSGSHIKKYSRKKLCQRLVEEIIMNK